MATGRTAGDGIPVPPGSGYGEFFGELAALARRMNVDEGLGAAIRDRTLEFLRGRTLGFDTYNEFTYVRNYVGRDAATGIEALVMSWSRGNVTSVHGHPQLACYCFADGDFLVETFEPVGGDLVRPSGCRRVAGGCGFYAVGLPGRFDNHIHRITCLSERGHSLHVYSDDALKGLKYRVAEEKTGCAAGRR